MGVLQTIAAIITIVSAIVSIIDFIRKLSVGISVRDAAFNLSFSIPPILGIPYAFFKGMGIGLFIGICVAGMLIGPAMSAVAGYGFGYLVGSFFGDSKNPSIVCSIIGTLILGILVIANGEALPPETGIGFCLVTAFLGGIAGAVGYISNR